MAVSNGVKSHLTLAEQTAIEAIQADIARLQNKLRAVLTEAGLDPNGNFRIQPDGSIEVVDASS
jgi:hypothetical protein